MNPSAMHPDWCGVTRISTEPRFKGIRADAIAVNKSALREACRRNGVKSFAALAERLGVSRPSIYFCLERPSRFPRVNEKLTQFCQ